MTIVIVEDDKPLNFAIKLLLEKNEHLVYTFEDANLLIENIDSIGKVDLFIIDINLPSMNGLDLMDAIKNYTNSSYIIISAYNDISHITEAFNLGCDDYLKKPFEIEELLLRIKKIEKIKYPKYAVQFGNGYEYDFEKKLLKQKNKKIILTKKEQCLIETLLLNRGQIVSFDKIRENVWNGEYVSSNTISATMHRLREKIDKDTILTYRDIGYSIDK